MARTVVADGEVATGGTDFSAKNATQSLEDLSRTCAQVRPSRSGSADAVGCVGLVWARPRGTKMLERRATAQSFAIFIRFMEGMLSHCAAGGSAVFFYAVGDQRNAASNEAKTQVVKVWVRRGPA